MRSLANRTYGCRHRPCGCNPVAAPLPYGCRPGGEGHVISGLLPLLWGALLGDTLTPTLTLTLTLTLTPTVTLTLTRQPATARALLAELRSQVAVIVC